MITRPDNKTLGNSMISDGPNFTLSQVHSKSRTIKKSKVFLGASNALLTFLFPTTSFFVGRDINDQAPGSFRLHSVIESELPDRGKSAGCLILVSSILSSQQKQKAEVYVLKNLT